MQLNWAFLGRATRVFIGNFLALHIMVFTVPVVLAAQHAEHRVSSDDAATDASSIPLNYVIQADPSAMQAQLRESSPSISGFASQNARTHDSTPKDTHQVRLGAEFVQTNISPLLSASKQGRTADLSLVPTLSMALPDGRKIERVQQYFRGR